MLLSGCKCSSCEGESYASSHADERAVPPFIPLAAPDLWLLPRPAGARHSRGTGGSAAGECGLD